jgi:hypothetical protein
MNAKTRGEAVDEISNNLVGHIKHMLSSFEKGTFLIKYGAGEHPHLFILICAVGKRIF